jgi:hypothetical protein
MDEPIKQGQCLIPVVKRLNEIPGAQNQAFLTRCRYARWG